MHDEFLAAAMRRVPPGLLCPDSEGRLNLLSHLLEPKRRRLQIPAVSQTTYLQCMYLLQQLVEGKMDVADLSDFD